MDHVAAAAMCRGGWQREGRRVRMEEEEEEEEERPAISYLCWNSNFKLREVEAFDGGRRERGRKRRGASKRKG
jgi:hypothetical protein